MDKNDKALNDTWIWDGKDWKNATPAGASNSPSARSGHTLVYDTNRQEYILFGGSNGSSLFRDTWAYRLSGTRYVSTTGSDSGTCLDEKSPCATLNYAIIRAVPGDEIKVASGDYDTSNQNTGSRSEVVNVYQDVTLTGGWDAGFKNQSGLTRIVGSGSSSSPIRSVTVPKGAKVSLQNIEIWNGRSALGGGILNEGHLTLETVIVYGGVASQAGGGIHNKGSMALTNCVINNNRAPNGGGIYNNGGTLAISDSIIDENNASKNGGGINQWAGSLTLSRSIVESNDATSGAGLYLDYTSSSGSPTVTIENSIVSFNQMTDKGGGIYVNYGDLTLSSSTISVNGATVDTATTSGGGLYNEHGNIQMNNTIVAKNVAGPSAPDCAGAATSNDHNLIGDATGCGITKATNDQFGSANSPIDPLFTSTVSVPANYELGANSPAVDAGNPAKPGSGGFACPVNDQHKVSREKHRPCDIGAYEYVK
ncbi:MAG: hypothetical protein H8D34_04215 [Chloroflexi bacterium]|nr:hypothetical protein [Chloroflexota bacterium]